MIFRRIKVMFGLIYLFIILYVALSFISNDKKGIYYNRMVIIAITFIMVPLWFIYCCLRFYNNSLGSGDSTTVMEEGFLACIFLWFTEDLVYIYTLVSKISIFIFNILVNVISGIDYIWVCINSLSFFYLVLIVLIIIYCEDNIIRNNRFLFALWNILSTIVIYFFFYLILYNNNVFLYLIFFNYFILFIIINYFFYKNIANGFFLYLFDDIGYKVEVLIRYLFCIYFFNLIKYHKIYVLYKFSRLAFILININRYIYTLKLLLMDYSFVENIICNKVIVFILILLITLLVYLIKIILSYIEEEILSLKKEKGIPSPSFKFYLKRRFSLKSLLFIFFGLIFFFFIKLI